MEQESIFAFTITAVSQLTHDTRQFTFAIPQDIKFDYLPGDYIKVFPNDEDPDEFRTYTPTTPPSIDDHFELIVKRYPDGQVSRFMHDRKIGDEVWIGGPYPGGHFVEGMASRLGMVAAGTGITPMIAIIRTILRQGIKADISLIFANKSIDDIILKDEFDSYVECYPNFRRYYVVDQAPPEWDMGIGRIDAGIMKAHLPEPSDQTVIFLCGPPMMQIELRKKLIEMGHRKEKIIIP